MCTAMTVQVQGNTYFGRTMDFSYPLDPELYTVPRGYEWSNMLGTHKIRNKYGYMGIGQDISPVVFADGVNEMGFGAAVLYFPGYAQYDPAAPRETAGPSVAATELVGFLLGLCAGVDQVASLLHTIRIVGIKDPVTNTVAPLHWIVADKSGKCMVIEKTAEGLQLMDNPIGVLSNSPDFRWHMTNLRNYMNVTPFQHPEKKWGEVCLTPFGQGAGAFGLPGDYTPPARFVRTAYQKSHAAFPASREEAITACFHIMEGVTIPKGVVMTERKTADYTQYTAFMDLCKKRYFFRTYDNSQIVSAELPASGGPQIRSLGKLRRPVVFARQERKT